MVFKGPAFHAGGSPLYLKLALRDEISVMPSFPFPVPCNVTIGCEPPARDPQYCLAGAEHLLHDYRGGAVLVTWGWVVV